MDELTLLREFRSDVPGPSTVETTAARDRLVAVMDDAQSGSGRPSAAPRPAFPAGRDGRRFWIPVAVAAAATAVGIAAVSIAVSGPWRTQLGSTQPGSKPATLTAAIVLRQAASAAARRPAGHGRFFVSESEYITPADGQDDPALRAIWIGNGATGRLVQTGQGSAVITPGISFGRRTLTWTQLQRLPVAPGPLLADIARVSGNMGQPLVNAEFHNIVGLLFESPSPPALRSALYDVAARLPGVTLVSNSRDLIGRTAAEVYLPPGFPGNGGEALFFDPSSSAVLGVASLDGSRLQCPPIWEDAVLASGYVSSNHQLPPGAPRSPWPVTRAIRVPGCPKPSSAQPTASPAPVRSAPATSATSSQQAPGSAHG
jgi:hypothetical protein